MNDLQWWSDSLRIGRQLHPLRGERSSESSWSSIGCLVTQMAFFVHLHAAGLRSLTLPSACYSCLATGDFDARCEGYAP